jgi:UDP-N-acetylmuramate dehydrogenase
MKTNVNLKPYNSFGFDAVAKHFAEINEIQELESLIRSDVFKHEKYLILSGGNNVLFRDDFFDGVVVHINTKGIETLEEQENNVIVRAQAGEDWPEFVRFCVEKGWHGVENLAHIPGKVGAAPVQNIGAYGMELKDSFVQCEAMDLATGETKVFTKEECRFGYRESVFKHELKGQYVITSVDFLLKKNAPLHLEYGNIKSYLEQNGIESPTLQQLHDAICAIRDAKLPDVKQIGSAGSFFKNPVIDRAQFEALQKDYPKMPHYDEPNGKVKVPAGWLIEHSCPSTLRLASGTAGSGTAGATSWKGWRDEHVGVYDKQALVLVHYGGGTGQDIVELAHRIQDSVEEKFGIKISPEVNFV